MYHGKIIGQAALTINRTENENENWENELVDTIASKNLDLIYLVFHVVTKENVLFLILVLPTQQLRQLINDYCSRDIYLQSVKASRPAVISMLKCSTGVYFIGYHESAAFHELN